MLGSFSSLSHGTRVLSAKFKDPTSLVAIAAVFCIGGGGALLSVALGAALLPRHPYPDKVVQTLYRDPSVRPFLICEGIGALLLGITGLTAGVMVFARAKV